MDETAAKARMKDEEERRSAQDGLEGKLSELGDALEGVKAQIDSSAKTVTEGTAAAMSSLSAQLRQAEEHIRANEMRSAAEAEGLKREVDRIASERKAEASELAEAQEGLASTRSLLVGTKDEQIAAAHAQINTLEGTVGALKARVATAEEHGGIQREELRMRVEQVRTTAGSNAPTHACLPLLALPHF